MAIQTNELGMCSVESQNACGEETRKVIKNTCHSAWNETQKRHVSVSNLHPYSEHHKHGGEASVPAMHDDTMMYAEGPLPERFFCTTRPSAKIPVDNLTLVR